MSIKSAGPQLNQTRDDFNKRVEKKSILGNTKKVIWNSRRRHSNI